MICYEVLHNGERLCVAGVPSGVLVAGLTWGSHGEGADSPWSLDLRVGGLTENTHVDWVLQPLRVGDEVAFRIVEAEKSDPPVDLSLRTRCGHTIQTLKCRGSTMVS